MAETGKQSVDVPTAGAQMGGDPNAQLHKSLLAGIQSLNPAESDYGVKLMTLFGGYFKATGQNKLADQVNDILLANQQGKFDLRKAFANSGQEIWKLARTKEQEVQAANLQEYFKTTYGLSDKEQTTRLSLVSNALEGISGGYRLIGMIGAIISFIPGLEDIGNNLVRTAKEKAMELDPGIVSKNVRLSNQPIHIADASAGEAAAKMTSYMHGLLGDGAVKADADATVTTRAGVGATVNPAMPQSEIKTKTPVSTRPKDQADVAFPGDGLPAVCGTPYGKKSPVCRGPIEITAEKGPQ